MSQEINKPESVQPKKWMNVKEVAEYLGVKVPTVYAWVSNRLIPFHKPKGTQLLRFNLAQINAWLDQAKVESTDEYFNRTRGG